MRAANETHSGGSGRVGSGRVMAPKETRSGGLGWVGSCGGAYENTFGRVESGRVVSCHVRVAI